MSDKKKFIDNFIPTSKSDISEIKKLLIKLHDYSNDLRSFYSIKEDVVEITDKRRSLSKLLNRHIDDFQNDSAKLTSKINEELTRTAEVRKRAEALLVAHEEFSSEIKEINDLLNDEDENEHRYHDTLIELISSKNILNLKNKCDEITEFWSELHHADDDTDNIIEQTQSAYSEINDLYNNILVRDDSGTSKEEDLNQFFKDIKEQHKKIVEGYTTIQDEKEVKVSPYADQIKEQKDKLDDFHNKIYGDGSGNGLEGELEERLNQLNEIEIEAKKVIGLSSDAGLAGGFSERGKKAKFNKFISLGIFISIMLVLGMLNIYDPESDTFSLKHIEDLKDINVLLVKLVFNIPFIWIAIVANVNLNKYSRLEEEYAHKESLAKSFERYKEQIQNLENNEDSEKLMLRLLKANISAFEKNAADTMDKAKADIFKPSINQKTEEDNSKNTNESSDKKL